MDSTVDKFAPVIFQKLNTYENEDSRLLKVKIWLMHLGENLNGSYFDKEIVTEAIPTLANTPILAYIEQNSDDVTDFSDHRMVLTKKDGNFEVKYIGQAIGLIPETNNAKFEVRLCDDGIEREFLTCEGFVWQKWDDPVDIFNRDFIKSQSMELHDDYLGEWKDKLFHFTKFSFFGACALGGEVLPAMTGSTIEVQFSHKDMFRDIQEKMESFKQSFSLESEGGNEMAKENNKEETIKIPEEQIEQTEQNIVTEAVEIDKPTEEKLKEREVTAEETTLPTEPEVDYQAEYEKFKSQLEEVSSDYSKLKEEAEGLRQFKAEKLASERLEKETELFESFSSELTEDEVKALREDSSQFSLEQIEEKLYTLVGKKKATFSTQAKKEKKTIKVDVVQEKQTVHPYGGLFEKYLGN